MPAGNCVQCSFNPSASLFYRWRNQCFKLEYISRHDLATDNLLSSLGYWSWEDQFDWFKKRYCCARTQSYECYKLGIAGKPFTVEEAQAYLDFICQCGLAKDVPIQGPTDLIEFFHKNWDSVCSGELTPNRIGYYLATTPLPLVGSIADIGGSIAYLVKGAVNAVSGVLGEIYCTVAGCKSQPSSEEEKKDAIAEAVALMLAGYLTVTAGREAVKELLSPTGAGVAVGGLAVAGYLKSVAGKVISGAKNLAIRTAGRIASLGTVNAVLLGVAVAVAILDYFLILGAVEQDLLNSLLYIPTWLVILSKHRRDFHPLSYAVSLRCIAGKARELADRIRNKNQAYTRVLELASEWYESQADKIESLYRSGQLTPDRLAQIIHETFSAQIAREQRSVATAYKKGLIEEEPKQSQQSSQSTSDQHKSWLDDILNRIEDAVSQALKNPVVRTGAFVLVVGGSLYAGYKALKFLEQFLPDDDED